MNKLTIHYNGGLRWRNQHGISHNKYNPSVKELDGITAWITNSKIHRLNGPAITYSSGNVEFWVNGIEYFSPLEYLIAVEQYKQIT